jgi:hypothetical protein
LIEQFESEQRGWAADGLTRLTTPEARYALWRARSNGTIA